jgi:dephospho-CoA kinase
MLRVGLTGGIACGKSRVLNRLGALGLATLDLDALAHHVMAPGGPAHDAVVAAFGSRILTSDGSIDRKALGAVVFSDPAARSRLEALVHPRVRAEEAERAARLEGAGEAVLVSDGALLVEAGIHLRFDCLVVVHCPPEVQMQRLVARDGLSDSAAQARLDAQMATAEKRRFAHLEIETTGSLDETDAAAKELAAVLRARAIPVQQEGPAPGARALGALVHGGEGGPRGLAPRTFLEITTEQGGIELPALAQRLEPPAAGPWYRAARPEEAGPWPEALAATVALWALARGRDEDWLLGAAASLARLTHDEGAAMAGAGLAALAARAVAASGSLHTLEGRIDEWEDRAGRWGGTAPAPRVRRALNAAAAHPDDPLAAREAAAASDAEPALAGGLVGLALGEPAEGAEPALVGLVSCLSSIPR